MTGTFLFNLPQITFKLWTVHTRLCVLITGRPPLVIKKFYSPSTNYQLAIFCNFSFELIPNETISLPKVHANRRIFWLNASYSDANSLKRKHFSLIWIYPLSCLWSAYISSNFQVLPLNSSLIFSWKYCWDKLESGNPHSIVLACRIPFVKDDCIAISGYFSPF